jgi:hypothetical protein
VNELAPRDERAGDCPKERVVSRCERFSSSTSTFDQGMAMRLKQTAFLSTLSAVAVLMCAKPVHAKNLFVTTTGSDAVTWALNDASHAWRTLAKAGLEAKAGDTVFIGAGSYTTPLVVANSGTSSTPIVFRAGSIWRAWAWCCRARAM